jgi:hypothetical protein
MNRSLLAATLAALLAAPAAAQQPPGDARLDRVAGAVSIIAGGGKTAYRAKGGEALLFGDAVRTGPGAVAQLVMADGTVVLLHENARLALSGTPRRTLLDVARGEFVVGLKKVLAKGGWLKLRTPSAVAAVRGTLFWGKVDKEKTLTLAGFAHRVEVTALGKTVAVDAGMMTTVRLGQPPEEPRRHDIPWDYMNRFHVDGQLQGVESLVDMPKPEDRTPE